jgi:hypothetical protein
MRAIASYFLPIVIFSLSTIAHAKEIGPGEDYCRAINDPNAGHTFALKPGKYQNACKIRRGGTTELPLTIAAADNANPPTFEYQGTTSNVFEIYADHIVIRGLQFVRSQTDAIRVISGNNITIEDCKCFNLGGIAVVATHRSIKGFTVRRNTITDSLSTAMYFGCHEGSDCAIRDLLVEDNHIREVTAADPAIGYGIQVKLNSIAIIRGNRIANTKGPGIMVYGAHNATETSLIERNFVSGSRRSSGILVGGGPAVVRNNISIHNREGGVGLQDYDNRGLLRNIIVAHNTMYGNEKGGIFISADKLTDVDIVNNAGVMARSLAIRGAAATRIYAAGNIDCATVSCFKDPEKLDFAPAEGSPLLGTSIQIRKDLPTDDFFARRRNSRPAVGAIETPNIVP